MPTVRVAAVVGAISVAGFAVSGSAGTSPPAPAIAPDFTIIRDQPLPGRCAPTLVAPRLAAALGAFNAGRVVGFAERFAAHAQFNPYNGRPRGSYRATGRAAISSVARKRHQAGDGWTAFRLIAPVTTTRDEGREAIFGLFLRVRVDGAAFEQGVKVIVSCSTGRILVWLGPAWKT